MRASLKKCHTTRDSGAMAPYCALEPNEPFFFIISCSSSRSCSSILAPLDGSLPCCLAFGGGLAWSFMGKGSQCLTGRVASILDCFTSSLSGSGWLSFFASAASLLEMDCSSSEI